MGTRGKTVWDSAGFGFFVFVLTFRI